MKKSHVLLCLALLTSPAGAQQFQFPFPYPIIRDRPRIYVPDLEVQTSSFAYLQESGEAQTLKLARLVQGFLLPTAVPIRTLATENGITEEIFDLFASPSNRWLAVYTFQDQFTGFIDHNLTFFDMVTGASLGLRNEHAFSGLNQAVAPSTRLAEFKAVEAGWGVPPEDVATINYTVDTESTGIPAPTYQWNADGTFSLTYVLEVLAFYPEAEPTFIGTEAFTMTIALSGTGVVTVDFGGTRAPAIFPAVFSLTPVNGPASEIRFESRPVRFEEFYYNFFLREFIRYYVYPTATMTEGNIPRRLRPLF